MPNQITNKRLKITNKITNKNLFTNTTESFNRNVLYEGANFSC